MMENDSRLADDIATAARLLRYQNLLITIDELMAHPLITVHASQIPDITDCYLRTLLEPQVDAIPVIDYYLHLDGWSLSDAAALAVCADPKLVRPTPLYLNPSWHERYDRALARIERAVAMGALPTTETTDGTHLIEPATFYAWASEQGLIDERIQPYLDQLPPPRKPTPPLDTAPPAPAPVQPSPAREFEDKAQALYIKTLTRQQQRDHERLEKALELKARHPYWGIPEIAQAIFDEIPEEHQSERGNSVNSIATRLYKLDETHDQGEDLKRHLKEKRPLGEDARHG